jgi:hypothetical protein
MTFNVEIKVGTTEPGLVVILKNPNEGEVISDVFMQFSRDYKDPKAINVEVVLNNLDLTMKTREEKKFKIKSKKDLHKLMMIKNNPKVLLIVKKVEESFIPTLISMYLPTNWLLLLPEE